MAKGVKTGGRQKGTLNQDKANLFATAERIGVDPFEVLCMVAAGDWEGLGYSSDVYHVEKADGDGSSNIIEKPTITLDQRIQAAKEAAKYLYAQRKAIEVDPENAGFAIVIKDYTSAK